MALKNGKLAANFSQKSGEFYGRNITVLIKNYALGESTCRQGARGKKQAIGERLDTLFTLWFAKAFPPDVAL